MGRVSVTRVRAIPVAGGTKHLGFPDIAGEGFPGIRRPANADKKSDRAIGDDAPRVYKAAHGPGSAPPCSSVTETFVGVA